MSSSTQLGQNNTRRRIWRPQTAQITIQSSTSQVKSKTWLDSTRTYRVWSWRRTHTQQGQEAHDRKRRDQPGTPVRTSKLEQMKDDSRHRLLGIVRAICLVIEQCQTVRKHPNATLTRTYQCRGYATINSTMRKPMKKPAVQHWVTTLITKKTTKTRKDNLELSSRRHSAKRTWSWMWTKFS